MFVFHVQHMKLPYNDFPVRETFSAGFCCYFSRKSAKHDFSRKDINTERSSFEINIKTFNNGTNQLREFKTNFRR